MCFKNLFFFRIKETEKIQVEKVPWRQGEQGLEQQASKGAKDAKDPSAAQEAFPGETHI